MAIKLLLYLPITPCIKLIGKCSIRKLFKQYGESNSLKFLCNLSSQVSDGLYLFLDEICYLDPGTSAEPGK